MFGAKLPRLSIFKNTVSPLTQICAGLGALGDAVILTATKAAPLPLGPSNLSTFHDNPVIPASQNIASLR